METKHSLLKSFQFAFEGIRIAIVKGRNFKIQLFLAFVVSVLGVGLRISAFEWLDLFLIINLVLILELLNTSIEAVVDLVSPEIKEKAKVAKDVAAAAVLISSITSLLVGAVIFIPKIQAFL